MPVMPQERSSNGRVGRLLRRVTIVSVLASALLTLAALAALHLYLASHAIEASGGPMFAWTEEDGIVTPKGSWFHIEKPMRMDVVTDSRGARVAARGDETPVPVDVMAVGCSWTYGWGVEEPETFARILAEDLGIRVANLGVPSTGTTSALRTIERHRDLAPRVVLYTFMQDHLARNLTPCAAIDAPKCISVPYVRWEDGVPRILPPIGSREDFAEIQRSLTRFARNRVLDVPLIALDGLRALRRRFDVTEDRSAIVEEHGLATLTFLLERMAEESRRIGATLVVLYFPRIDGQTVQPAPRALVDALPDDVRLVDLTPELRSYLSRARVETLVIPNDGHPNPTMYELFARAVAPVVADALAAARARPTP